MQKGWRETICVDFNPINERGIECTRCTRWTRCPVMVPNTGRENVLA